MSSSINTAWARPETNKRWRSLAANSVVLICLAAVSFAQVGALRAPTSPVAGNPASISTTGSGAATFYLIGPSVALKREVKLGLDIALAPDELRSAGEYLGTVCADACRSVEFFVTPAKAASLAFLVHPSRAPVAEDNVISAVVLPFDQFKNMILAPTEVDFQLTAKGAAPISRRISTQEGVAWFRTNSGRSAGALQVVASVSDVSVRRIVQEVASNPCNLRIKGQRTAKGVVVETDPVRDCAGNPVPDGTVVTFTAKDGNETSTVDAPIKQGVARAQLIALGPVVISAASGVVMGNEIRLGAQ